MNQPKPPSSGSRSSARNSQDSSGTHPSGSKRPSDSKRVPGSKHASGSERSARLNLRARAIVLLQQVAEGQSLAQIMGPALEKTPEKDKGLLNELVLGTLRHWFALDAQIQPMLAKPLSDSRVHIALLLGLYQLLQTRIPAHAAISETVEAIRQLKLDKASGLVNALLRRSTREMDQVVQNFAQQHGMPHWLQQYLQTDWPTQWLDIAQTLRQTAPLTLRVNSRQESRDEYLRVLQLNQIDAVASPMSPDGIQLQQAVPVTSLMGFEQGWFSVQDEHAQLCAGLLGQLDGKVVLDACAAPGGKTAHLLEKNDPALLVALDHDQKRLQRVHDNLYRLQLDHQPVQVITADAVHWQSDQSFDCILLDAPCTATGVIRRHPDILLLRQANDVEQTVQLQAALLQQLWPQLKPGGQLLYVTCSILKQENEQQMLNFLQQMPDASSLPINLPIHGEHAIAQQVGVQLLPQAQGGDGFYFCLLSKTASAT